MKHKQKNDNNKVCDINKVQYAELFFVNQYGNKRMSMPKHPSVRGDEFAPDAMCYKSGMSMMEYATKNNLLDVWIPVAEFQYASNHYLSFTGDKALAMWKVWRAKIFGASNK